MSLPLPSDRRGILTRLADERLITANRAGGWDVTNLGAILFSKNLEQFPALTRKAVRVIVYQGPGRLVSESEYVSQRGYAAGFEAFMTNTSLRERFAIPSHNSATASRIIRDTMEEGLVKPSNPEQGRKLASYVPYWA